MDASPEKMTDSIESYTTQSRTPKVRNVGQHCEYHAGKEERAAPKQESARRIRAFDRSEPTLYRRDQIGHARDTRARADQS